MFQPIMSLRGRAEFYQRQLPQTMRRYINGRGIPDTFIERYALGWDGKAITIPVEDSRGEIVFLKLANPSDGSLAPKMQKPRAPAELYPWKTLQRHPGRIVITANEFDCLALEARGFPAVCSTAGEGRFEKEWTKHFEEIDHVYVCFNRSTAGTRAAKKVAARIPGAKTVSLPEAVGRGGSVADFFVRLGNTQSDFEMLLAGADSVLSAEVAETPPPITRFLKRAERLQAEVSITRVIGRYTTLHYDGGHLIGRCPLHEEAAPTLHVYPKTQSYHCYGCGAGGDVISFLEKADNLTFGQALEALEKIRYSDDFPNVA